MKFILDDFDSAMGTGLRLADDTGASIALPQVVSYHITPGKTESHFVGNEVVINTVQPPIIEFTFLYGVGSIKLKYEAEKQ